MGVNKLDCFFPPNSLVMVIRPNHEFIRLEEKLYVYTTKHALFEVY